VKALGVADPINATTAGGAATSTVTPLSGIGSGVVARAVTLLQAGDWRRLFNNFDDFRGEEGDECENNLDDDGDTLTNDGCPAYGAAETVCDNPPTCLESEGEDNEPPWEFCDEDDDDLINDGCPAQGTWTSVHDEEFPLVDVLVESTVLVQCTEPAPAAAEPAAPPAPAAAPAILPPATGDGGYLPAGQASSGSSAISWWLALPLSVGTLLLASGLALRRRAL
jgi:hypothetical protein